MQNKREKTLFSVIVYLSLILSALICAGVNKMTLPAAAGRVGYSIVLGVLFIIFFDMLWEQLENPVFYVLVFGAAVCLIGVASRYSVGLYWMLPLVFIARFRQLPVKALTVGMLMMVYLCNSALIHGQLSWLVYYLIMGLAVTALLSVTRQKQEYPYVCVILAALCVALLVLHYNFDLQEFYHQRYTVILELCSLCFLLLTGAVCSVWEKVGSPAVCDDESVVMSEHVEKDAEETAGISEEPMVQPETVMFTEEKKEEPSGEESSLELGLLAYLQDDFPLIERMREREDLYQHSYEISRLSSLAARALKCDRALAAAGGMFHEMGRLAEGKDYMEANLEYAREYDFPEPLVDVIRQHNTGSEIPKSPEAAIVMLSDCIVSTWEFLKKSGKGDAITGEKLVKSIFANRKAKGSLDEAGLDEEQLQKLQAFYISEMEG